MFVPQTKIVIPYRIGQPIDPGTDTNIVGHPTRCGMKNTLVVATGDKKPI